MQAIHGRIGRNAGVGDSGRAFQTVPAVVNKAVQQGTTVIIASHDAAWLQSLRAEQLCLHVQDDE